MATSDEGVLPRPVEHGVRVSGRVGDGAGDARPDPAGPGQIAAHPLVGREGLPCHEADRRELAGPLRVKGLGRLLGHDLVDLLEKEKSLLCTVLKTWSARLMNTLSWGAPASESG